jgi:hypothetical protein
MIVDSVFFQERDQFGLKISLFMMLPLLEDVARGGRRLEALTLKAAYPSCQEKFNPYFEHRFHFGKTGIRMPNANRFPCNTYANPFENLCITK